MRRITVGAVALGVALALAGCGGGGGATDAVSIKTLKTAAAITAQMDSMRFTVDTSTEFGGEQFTTHATGVTSGDGTLSQITITSGDLGESEVRTIDGVAYLKLGGGLFGSFAPAGKSWVRLDFGDLITGSESPLGETDPRASTPQSGLALLKDLTGGVDTVGDDTVAGRHATHYRGSIDSPKVGALPVPDDNVPVDVWIDDADRVVKMHLSIDVVGTELTWEVTEFGVPVDVVAPPPDEVMDFGDLLPGWQRRHDGVPA